jgi:D-serine deaminase-like pyridoxal phosphate-dependent protein
VVQTTDLDTPFLSVDGDIMERNLHTMAEYADHVLVSTDVSEAIALRPHAKTHKSPRIARRQLELGAVGLTVATVSEAELFADEGCTDLFLAYPIWADGERGLRLRQLADRVSLRVGVDSAEGASMLGTALRGAPAEVVIEIDSGQRRSGVPPENAADIARAVAGTGLTVAGVFTFPGHSYGPGVARQTASDDEAIALRSAAESLRAAGFPSDLRSGGSTPSVATAHRDAVTELRPGVYVFNDAQQVELGVCSWTDVALWAVGTVVSRRGQRFILDTGSKVLGADRPPWVTGFGRLPDHPEARITALSEHHATVEFSDGSPVPKLGSRVRVVPNHVCTAVNLADELVVVSGDDVRERWPVAARGANT